MKRFFIIFLLLQVALFLIEMHPWVQAHAVVPFTGSVASLSAWLIQLFDTHVHAYGVVIRNTQNLFAVEINAGCNGVEPSIILFAAVLAYPATIKQKVVGLIAGLGTIHALNIIRIISLFYLGQWNHTAFEWAHNYIWQAFIMVDALVVMLLWIRYVNQAKSH